MTEVEQGTNAVEEGSRQSKTAGQFLKAARQERGLHIAALAALLKVPQAKLEALEADRYADLPDATFARALAKAVCRTLKIDAAPVMALLPRGDGRELHVSLGINEPYREPGRGSEGLSLQWLRRPLVWVVGLLLLAAVGLYLAPAGWLERSPAVSSPTPASVASMASEPTLGRAPSVPLTVASEPVPGLATQPLTAPSPSPEASKPSVAATAVATLPAALPTSASAAAPLTLTVKTATPSWVEIVDANGQSLVSRVIAGGDEQQFSGQAPLKVKIGNVAGTQLFLRGKPVDLSSTAKDNVARLELN